MAASGGLLESGSSGAETVRGLLGRARFNGARIEGRCSRHSGQQEQVHEGRHSGGSGRDGNAHGLQLRWRFQPKIDGSRTPKRASLAI